MQDIDRPEKYTDEMKAFLDKLRESGIINMFGASQPLRVAFPELSHAESISCLTYWMQTFGEKK